MSRFGPTFGTEIIAAGLGGLPFCWSDNGTIQHRENLTPAQNTALDAVIAAHNPVVLTNKVQILADATLQDLQQKLANATPAQITNYVNNNVTDLASAKVLLAKIVLVLAAIWGSQS